MTVGVSQILRGAFYSTHLSARCPAYHRCLACGSCRHYDANDLTCRSCEWGHKQVLRCRCHPERLLAVRLINDRLKRDMFSRTTTGSTTITTVEEDAELSRFISDQMTFYSE